MILSLPAAQNRTTQPADPRPAREDVYVFRSVSPQIIFGPEARDAGPAHGRQAGRAERSPQRDSTQRFASGLTTGDVNRLSEQKARSKQCEATHESSSLMGTTSSAGQMER